MTSPIQKSIEVAHTLALRDQRFDALREAVENFECSECLGHDDTRPGGDHTGRYAVLAHANDGKLLELTRVVSKERAQVVVESHVSEGWVVSALYDLDELDGPEPLVYEGDKVEYAPGDVACRYVVQHVDEDLVEGEISRHLRLVEVGRTSEDLDDYDHRVHDSEVNVVERCEPDERLPARYTVADRRIIVVFNTVAS